MTVYTQASTRYLRLATKLLRIGNEYNEVRQKLDRTQHALTHRLPRYKQEQNPD